MKAKELREMTDVELNKQLKDLKAELFNLRFQHAINQLDNPVRIDAVKKDIARVMTIMAEKNVKNAQEGGENMERNLRKTRVGVVVSDKMDKTIVVAVKDSVQHPLYKKILKRTKKFKVHDENNEAGIGDRVEIMETRKISKQVNWRLVKILEKAK